MKNNVIREMLNHKSEYTPLESSIADFFTGLEDFNHLKITEVAKQLFLSTATISRFVNKLGYENYKAFLYDLQNAYQEIELEKQGNIQITKTLWATQQTEFEAIYESIGILDLDLLARKLLQCQLIVPFGFGKLSSVSSLFIDYSNAVEAPYYETNEIERLLNFLNSKADYTNVVVLFYDSDLYQGVLMEVTRKCKEKFIPLYIVASGTPSHKIDYGFIYSFPALNNLPNNKASYMKLMPYMLFVDALFANINNILLNTPKDSFKFY